MFTNTSQLEAMAAQASGKVSKAMTALAGMCRIMPAVHAAQAAITREMFDAFWAAYNDKAYLAVPDDRLQTKGKASRADLWRYLYDLPADTKVAKPGARKVTDAQLTLRAAINFDQTVRKNSKVALEATGRKRKSGKVTVRTFETAEAYLSGVCDAATGLTDTERATLQRMAEKIEATLKRLALGAAA